MVLCFIEGRDTEGDTHSGVHTMTLLPGEKTEVVSCCSRINQKLYGKTEK